MKAMLKYLLIAAVLFHPVASYAWGMLGHRVIGGIAEHHLSPAARKHVQRVFGTESLAMAGNWADFIRSDRSYDYLGPWHYVNMPAGMSPDAAFAFLQKDTSANLYNRLQFLIKELQGRKLDKTRELFYLRLLVHLAGDAHQPMHTARPEDRGGNNVRVQWFTTPTNLHRVWDEHLIEYQQLSYTEHIAAINHASPADISQWQKEPVHKWIIESYALAENVYLNTAPGDKLGYQYNFRYVDIMNKQLLKGGVRLAEILNRIYAR